MPFINALFVSFSIFLKSIFIIHVLNLVDLSVYFEGIFNYFYLNFA